MDRLIKNILGFGNACELKHVTFTFFEQYESFFKGFNTKLADENIELVKYIESGEEFL